MQQLLQIIETIVPELRELYRSRLQILGLLDHHQHRIGRKVLAQEIGVTERTIRTLLEPLREALLVDVNQQGAEITADGKQLLARLEEALKPAAKVDFQQKEAQLAEHLGISHCWILEGDAEADLAVYQLMGEKVANLLGTLLPLGRTNIAVTGGTTLAHIAKAFTPSLSQEREITFVPSRGGLGQSLNIQANAVGSQLAELTHSAFVPLYFPEDLAEATAEYLRQDPAIQKVIEMGKAADAILLSVGKAEVMAQRRFITESQIKEIKNMKAVGEAFGVFYNKEGEIVVSYPRVGLAFADLEQIPLIMTIVGGSSKAEAVEGFFKLAPSHSTLICDEGIANSILKGFAL